MPVKKPTYFVSFIFTYHVCGCLFFSPSCYWFSKHRLQDHLQHDPYRCGGAGASSCSMSEPGQPTQPGKFSSTNDQNCSTSASCGSPGPEDTFCKIKCYCTDTFLSPSTMSPEQKAHFIRLRFNPARN